jgi:hypothetical protein
METLDPEPLILLFIDGETPRYSEFTPAEFPDQRVKDESSFSTELNKLLSPTSFSFLVVSGAVEAIERGWRDREDPEAYEERASYRVEEEAKGVVNLSPAKLPGKSSRGEGETGRLLL